MQYEIIQSSRYETDAGANFLMHEKDFSLPLRLITMDCARLIYCFDKAKHCFMIKAIVFKGIKAR